MRKVFAMTLSAGLLFTAFGTNAQASFDGEETLLKNKFDQPTLNEGKIVPPTNEELEPLTPVDTEVNPHVQIVEVPGPIKWYTVVSNPQLGEIVKTNNTYERNLSIAQTLLGIATIYSVTASTEIAVALTNSPIRRMEQAYYTGEMMYIGEYYPTPGPGLSTVPFRYYTKTPLKIISSY